MSLLVLLAAVDKCVKWSCDSSDDDKLRLVLFYYLLQL